MSTSTVPNHTHLLKLQALASLLETRKISPTISPNVLVTGPMNHNGDEWEKCREGSKDVIVEGNGSLKYKEPPTYTKSV
jgi:hypothetical protein